VNPNIQKFSTGYQWLQQFKQLATKTKTIGLQEHLQSYSNRI